MLTNWVTPSELAVASFSARDTAQDEYKEPNVQTKPRPLTQEIIIEENSPVAKAPTIIEIPPIKETRPVVESDAPLEETKSSGPDLSSLLGMFSGANGGQDMGGLGAILGLLKGEKPDMMSLLPLMMSMIAKKPEKTTPKETEDDTKINLEDFVIE